MKDTKLTRIKLFLNVVRYMLPLIWDIAMDKNTVFVGYWVTGAKDREAIDKISIAHNLVCQDIQGINLLTPRYSKYGKN